MLFSLETIKEHLVVSISSLSLLTFLVTGCDQKSVVVKNFSIEKSELKLNGNEGKWYVNGTPFDGYAVTHYTNGQIAEKIGYVDGKKMGQAQWWHANGQTKTIVNYYQNKINGLKKSWWPNGSQAAETTLVMGVASGTQTYWHQNGNMSKRTNFLDGQQHGMQQAWLPNGKIYVNYEAKNGRVFGLRRSNLCYELEDEQLVFN